MLIIYFIELLLKIVYFDNNYYSHFYIVNHDLLLFTYFENIIFEPIFC